MADQAAGWPRSVVPTEDGSDRSRVRARNLSALSDCDLMELLKAAEHDALSELFGRYYRLVLSVASKILRDRGEAEDLMQEVFLELFRTADRYDPVKGPAKSWIVTLAYHKSLNRRKYLALRGAFEDLEISEFDQATAHLSAHSWSGAGSPDDDVLAVVRKGFDTLNAKQREVVQLACLEGYLLSEIADRTKESLGNVRHHYYRGIKKLREFVKDKSEPTRGGKAAFSGGGK